MEGFPKMSCEDWLLIFLGLNDGQPITGRLLFVKMLFTADKEILNNAINEVFEFYPDKHGPYSRAFPQCIDLMKSKKLIVEKEFKNDFSSTFEYNLTERGKSLANEKIKLINPEILKKLEALKSVFIEQGYKKVLRYVYQKYPEYTTASIIRDDVRNANYY